MLRRWRRMALVALALLAIADTVRRPLAAADPRA
jgi:hypothetical protein